MDVGRRYRMQHMQSDTYTWQARRPIGCSVVRDGGRWKPSLGGACLQLGSIVGL